MKRRRARRATAARKRPTAINNVPAGKLAACVACFLVLVIGAGLWTYAGPGPSAPRGAATDIVLDPGKSLPQIAAALHRAHLIRSGLMFMFAAKVSGSARLLKAGEYAFASRAPMSRILGALRDGRVVRRFVTVPEGVTSNVAVGILQSADYLAGDVATPAEGSILPETYEVRRGETRTEVLGRMTRARNDLLAALWSGRARGLPYQSPEQAVILASIVERETALPAERPRIAAVFINRLRRGMRLESDPTVIYGLTGGAPLGHGLRVSEIASQNPYNTYGVAGLPPTPIGNPGRAALEAALEPALTDDLYFVADGTGGHVFSDTYEGHLHNVASWRAIEQARAVEQRP